MRHASELATKARKHDVMEHGKDVWLVTSSSGNLYTVTSNESGAYRCNCRWGAPLGKQRLASGCSHALAVAMYEAGKAERKAVVHGTLSDAKRQHRRRVELGQELCVTLR